MQLELDYAARSDGGSEAGTAERAERIVREFATALPELRSILDSDVEAAYLADPAARSVDEVLICYPGIIAIVCYRLAESLVPFGCAAGGAPDIGNCPL